MSLIKKNAPARFYLKSKCGELVPVTKKEFVKRVYHKKA